MTDRAVGGRFAYERGIRRSDLPAPARHVALTIATWADAETGIIPKRFQPSLTTLEEATGMSRASVKRHLSVLEEAGWLGRDRPDVIKARTEHARTGYRLTVPQEAGLTVSLGSDRAQPRATESPELGSEGAQARPRVSPKSSFSSVSAESASLSSDATEPAPPGPPAPVERETDAAPSQKPTAAQRAVRSSGVVGLEEEQAFIAWATVKFDVQGPGWWKAAADDIPEHVEVWRAGLVVRSRPASDLPPWCGSCGAGSEHAARTNVRFRIVELLGETHPCPDCHPSAAQAA